MPASLGSRPSDGLQFEPHLRQDVLRAGVFAMHFRQYEWPQGRLMGSLNTPAQTGQLSGSGQVWPGRYSNSFSVLKEK